jgi:uncharacterized protein DUF4760
VHFVDVELAGKLKDPEFRYQLANYHARTGENQALIAKVNTVGNFYENVGMLVKTGLVDRDLALNMWSGTAPSTWDDLKPVAAIVRRSQGDALWENFEYFVVLAQDWVADHPNGTYPAGVRRIRFDDEWREADAQYAASRAPA